MAVIDKQGRYWVDEELKKPAVCPESEKDHKRCIECKALLTHEAEFHYHDFDLCPNCLWDNLDSRCVIE